MTRAYNTATTQQNSGGAVAGVTAGKNAIINGAFDIWQRGTSFTTSSAYWADRWYGKGASSHTVSRQATNDTTNLPFIQYCMRVQRNSGATSTVAIETGSNIETVNTIPFVGKTITLSYYARKGADFSAASNVISVYLFTGTGTDQNAFTGYSGNATPIATTSTLTTTWQRFQHTITLGTTVTEMMPYFAFTPTGTAGTNDYFEITGVQLEVGSVATPFSRAGGTIQGELAACQRYYQRIVSGGAYATISLMGAAQSTSFAYVYFPLKTSLRVTPSSVDFSAVGLDDGVNAVVAASNVDSRSSSPDVVRLGVTVASGLTVYRPYGISSNNNAAGYVGVSAEL